jgi:hypothetical protein
LFESSAPIAFEFCRFNVRSPESGRVGFGNGSAAAKAL